MPSKYTDCLVTDADLSGNDLNSCGDDTDTPQKCQELCQETSACVQFTWISSTFGDGSRYKECCMKHMGSVPGLFPENVAGLISGPKFCGNFLVVCF